MSTNIADNFEFDRNKNYVKWMDAGVAKTANKRKEDHYSKWLHENHIIPFAFYSASNIAPDTVKFINRLFAASNKRYQRTWNSEKERNILKNWFLYKYR